MSTHPYSFNNPSARTPEFVSVPPSTYFGNLYGTVRALKGIAARERLIALSRFEVPGIRAHAVDKIEADMIRGLRAAVRQWKFHYGMDNKYDGNGRKREPHQITSIMACISYPGDWQERRQGGK